MSRRAAVALALLLALAPPPGVPAATAAAPPAVFVDGRPVRLDVPPRLERGRVLVPLRGVFEALGAQVVYDPLTDAVVATRSGHVVVLRPGARVANVDGRAVALDVPARVVGGRTLVPLRFVVESLGVQVAWDGGAVRIETAPAPDRAVAQGALTVEEVAARGLAATVLVETDLGVGSGFFVDAQGTVVTNHHVVAGAAQAVVVTADGRRHAVLGVLAADPVRDVAVLRTEARGYPALDLAPGATLRHGQTVVAVGSPLGLSGSVSTGVVSNPSRRLGGVQLIQHTAPISPGNSGGPLLALSGAVVGVNTMVADAPAAQNVNFAVSAREVAAVLATATGPPRPLAGGDAAGFASWLAVRFRPELGRCRAEFPSADVPLDQARPRLAEAQACAHGLALATVLRTPEDGFLGARYHAFMAAAYVSAAAAAGSAAVDYGARGDAVRRAAAARASGTLLAAAEGHLREVGPGDRGRWAEPAPEDYLSFLTDGFMPALEACDRQVQDALAAVPRGDLTQAESLATGAAGCHEDAARALLAVRWAPEERAWLHFSLAMVAAIRAAEARGLALAVRTLRAGDAAGAEAAFEVARRLQALALWYGERAFD